MTVLSWTLLRTVWRLFTAAEVEIQATLDRLELAEGTLCAETNSRKQIQIPFSTSTLLCASCVRAGVSGRSPR